MIEFLLEFLDRVVRMIQSPTLAFLIAGAVAAALKSELKIPDSIYKFTVYMLLMSIGLEAGVEIREAEIMVLIVPAIICMVIGVTIILLGHFTLAKLPAIKRKDDAYATIGLFGAVSGSTMVAGMTFLEYMEIPFEAWVPALYPFMDIPALITAIVLANLWLAKQKGGANVVNKTPPVKDLIKECLQGTALTILIMGTLLGLLTRPERVLDEFYDPLFRGFLSLLMLILGIEAYQRLKEMIGVVQWYVLYAFIAPFVHGTIGFALAYIAYLTVGFSPGGVIMIAVIAASNSDISGPPTLRAGIPSANPSVYIGTSTGLGTAVAIALGIPFFVTLGGFVFGF